MNTKEILEILSEASRNLKNYPYDRILKAINSIALTDILGFRIPAGTSILRARPNTNKDFSHVSDISYPPTTNTFGRAHRPGHPMFYGAITSKENQNYLDMMVTVFAELMEIFRTKLINEGERKLSIGRWFNNDELYVIGMVFHDDYLKKNPELIGVYQNYLQYLQRFKQNESQIEILKLISKEFAKPSISDDNDYKISAAFVESILTKKSIYKLDGIVYPSVRCEGHYFNIALTPECINKRMRLQNVITTTVYYKAGFVINDYEKEAFLSQGEKQFVLSEITDKGLNLGKAKTLEILEQHIQNSKRIITL